MLTGFKNAKSINVLQKEDPNARWFLLLSEAIEGVLVEDTHRVYIDGDPYIVEFKFDEDLDLNILKKALRDKLLKIIEVQLFAAEIWINRFEWNNDPERIIQVIYKPYSRPRL